MATIGSPISPSAWAKRRAISGPKRSVSGERGWAISSSHDAREWADALTGAVSSARRVDPPEGYDWGRTAAVVSETIARMLG